MKKVLCIKSYFNTYGHELSYRAKARYPEAWQRFAGFLSRSDLLRNDKYGIEMGSKYLVSSITKKLFPILIFYILYFILNVPVAAQTIIDTTKKTALGVSPAIIETILDEKTPTEKEISLYNLTNFPIPIKTTIESFSPKERLEIPEKDFKKYDASTWVEIDKDQKDFILQPRESRKINFSVKQPTDASPGGHYTSIVFQPLVPEEMVSRQSVYIFARVAVLVFMQVKGDIFENLEYDKSNIKSFYQSPPDSLSIFLKNTGNNYLRPNGRLLIYNELNQKAVGQAGIVPSIIIPDTIKEYKVDFDRNIKFGIGKFSVRPEISYGVDNTLLETPKIFFYVFPYTYYLLFFIVAIPLVIITVKQKTRLSKAIKILTLGENYERIEKRQKMAELEKIRIKKIIIPKITIKKRTSRSLKKKRINLPIDN